MAIGLFGALANAIETVDIVVTKIDNTKETKTVRLDKIDANTSKLIIKAADIPADTKFIDIFADNAKAKKADDGFWLVNRGLMGLFKKDNAFRAENPRYMYLPYYAMKTPAETFIAIIDGMRFEFNVNIEAKSGVYKMYPRWFISDMGFKPYEDITITYFTLPHDADYNDMAKVYRAWKFARNPDILPIKERMKSQKYLEKLAKSFPVRLPTAYKPFNKKFQAKDYTVANEPVVKVQNSFKQTEKILQKMKDMGLNDIAACLTGWQTGGYDGRCPATFPVCPEAGGEGDLRHLIKFGQSLGYIFDGHSNYTDAFTCSPLWRKDIICTSPSGALEINGAWSGGRAYNLCITNAWNTFLQKDIEKIAELGFRGAHYVDVFTAVYPYRCCNPSHAANRKEQGLIQKQIALKCREMMGGFASECGFDHFIGQVDYINYVCAPMRAKRNATASGKSGQWDEVDAFVPFWELVYHDIVLSNPDKITQDTLSQEDNLTLIEFGGRPIFYHVSDKNINAIKKSYEQFMKLRYLQLEEMLSHKKISDGVFAITYGDGSKIVVNRSNSDYRYENSNVKAKDYLLIRP